MYKFLVINAQIKFKPNQKQEPIRALNAKESRIKGLRLKHLMKQRESDRTLNFINDYNLSLTDKFEYSQQLLMSTTYK